MTASFAVKMKSLSDVDLIRISSSDEDDGYEIEAVQAARNELQSRRISGEAIEETLDAEREQRFEESQKEHEELKTAEAIFFLVIGPLFVLSVAAAVVLRVRGYRKKSDQVFACIGWSFLFYFLIAMGLIFFNS